MFGIKTGEMHSYVDKKINRAINPFRGIVEHYVHKSQFSELKKRVDALEKLLKKLEEYHSIEYREETTKGYTKIKKTKKK